MIYLLHYLLHLHYNTIFITTISIIYLLQHYLCSDYYTCMPFLCMIFLELYSYYITIWYYKTICHIITTLYVIALKPYLWYFTIYDKITLSVLSLQYYLCYHYNTVCDILQHYLWYHYNTICDIIKTLYVIAIKPYPWYYTIYDKITPSMLSL